jgi:hypothetical protein
MTGAVPGLTMALATPAKPSASAAPETSDRTSFMLRRSSDRADPVPHPNTVGLVAHVVSGCLSSSADGAASCPAPPATSRKPARVGGKRRYDADVLRRLGVGRRTAGTAWRANACAPPMAIAAQVRNTSPPPARSGESSAGVAVATGQTPSPECARHPADGDLRTCLLRMVGDVGERLTNAKWAPASTEAVDVPRHRRGRRPPPGNAPRAPTGGADPCRCARPGGSRGQGGGPR